MDVSEAKQVLRNVEEEEETFCFVGSNYIGLLDITVYCGSCESTQLAAEIAVADCLMDLSMWELAWECYYSGC